MVPLCFIIPVALWSSYNKGYKASKLRLAFNYALIAVLSAIALVATVGSSASRCAGLLLSRCVARALLRVPISACKQGDGPEQYRAHVQSLCSGTGCCNCWGG